MSTHTHIHICAHTPACCTHMHTGTYTYTHMHSHTCTKTYSEAYHKCLQRFFNNYKKTFTCCFKTLGKLV